MVQRSLQAASAEAVAGAHRSAIDLAPREDRFRAALRDYEERARG